MDADFEPHQPVATDFRRPKYTSAEIVLRSCAQGGSRGENGALDRDQAAPLSRLPVYRASPLRGRDPDRPHRFEIYGLGKEITAS